MYLDTCHFWFVFIIDYQSLLPPQTIVVFVFNRTFKQLNIFLLLFQNHQLQHQQQYHYKYIFFFHISHPTNKLKLKTFKSGFLLWIKQLARNCFTMKYYAALMPGQSQCLLHATQNYISVLYSLFHLPVLVSKYVLFLPCNELGENFFFLLLLLLVIIIFLLTFRFFFYFLSIFHIFSQLLFFLIFL